MEAKDNFVIDTKGLCLLCLSDFGEHDSNGHVPSSTSLLPFLRYLQINIFKVNNALPSAMSGMQEYPVIVTMCRWCTAMTNQFTDMFTTWEKIKLKIDDCVQLMYQQMLIGNGDTSRINEYWRRMRGCTDPFEIVNANLVENLRKEAIDKCSTRANSYSPPGNYRVSTNTQITTPTTGSEPLLIHIPAGLNDMIPVGGAISCNLLTVPSTSHSNVQSSPYNYDCQSTSWRTHAEEPYVQNDSTENKLYMGKNPTPYDTPLSQEVGQCYISDTGSLVIVDSIDKKPTLNVIEPSSSFSSRLQTFSANVDTNNDVFIPTPNSETGMQYCNKSLPPRKRKQSHESVTSMLKPPSPKKKELPILAERCCLCNETLKTNFAIKFHMIGVHAYHMIQPYLPQGTTNNLLLDINTEMEKIVQDLGINAESPYWCSYCNRKCDSKNLLKGHLIQMHCDKIAERIIMNAKK